MESRAIWAIDATTNKPILLICDSTGQLYVVSTTDLALYGGQPVGPTNPIDISGIVSVSGTVLLAPASAVHIIDDAGNEITALNPFDVITRAGSVAAVQLIDETGTAYGVTHIQNKIRTSSMPYLYDIAESNLSGPKIISKSSSSICKSKIM